jgi:hypothetical protein
MRSAIAIVSAVAMLVAQMPPVYAQNAISVPAQPVALSRAQDAVDRATPSAAIVEAFNAFPKGGDLLSKRIADVIVKEPKLAVGLVKYVQTANLSKEQKMAAERGLAVALDRLGIKAADMPVKAPVAAPAEDWTWLLGLLLIPGIICLGLCRHHNEEVTPF